MRTSAQGRAFLEHEEGLRLEAYSDGDPSDPPEREPVWTIGYGHTGKDVHEGLVWTPEQCDDALARDLRWVEQTINQHARIPPTQNQFDAFASLCFNIGAQRFRNSTALRKYNANDIAGAADAFLMWRIPPRLFPRRLRERALFLRA
jgi:lysozyme